MKQKLFNSIDIISLVLIGVISRLMPHPANMTAVGALSLFSGVKYSFNKAIAVTMSTMLITDLFLGLHNVMWATYSSFLAVIFLGRLISKKNNPVWILSGAISASVLFFIITNFAVWLSPDSMYPKTISGMIECYIMALPFFRNTIMGDMTYTMVFFGGYEIVKNIRKNRAVVIS